MKINVVFNKYINNFKNSLSFIEKKLNEKNILVSVTEMNTEEDIEDYVNTIK